MPSTHSQVDIKEKFQSVSKDNPKLSSEYLEKLLATHKLKDVTIVPGPAAVVMHNISNAYAAYVVQSGAGKVHPNAQKLFNMLDELITKYPAAFDIAEKYAKSLKPGSKLSVLDSKADLNQTTTKSETMDRSKVAALQQAGQSLKSLV